MIKWNCQLVEHPSVERTHGRVELLYKARYLFFYRLDAFGVFLVRFVWSLSLSWLRFREFVSANLCPALPLLFLYSGRCTTRMVPESRLPHVGTGEVEHAQGKVGAPRQVAREGETPPTSVWKDRECEMLRECGAQRWNCLVFHALPDIVSFIFAVIRAAWVVERAMCLAWCF